MIKRLSVYCMLFVIFLLVISIKPVLAGAITQNDLQNPLSNSLSSSSSAGLNTNNSFNGMSSIGQGNNAAQPNAHIEKSQSTLQAVSFNLNQMAQKSLISSTSISNAVTQAQSLSVTAPHGVEIKLIGESQVNLSDPILLSGNLKDLTTGTGIADKSIKFYISNFLLAQARTGNDGSYQVKINKNLAAGDYRVTASFTGAHLLAAASTNIKFSILPATVRVQTVPAIAGIPFSMDGKSFTSGPDGIAQVVIEQAGQYNLSVLLDQYNNPTEQVQFGRWTDETNQPSRLVQVPDNHVIQVGINVFHKVGLKFMDLEGFPVDPSRVSSVTIRSIQGDIFTLKPDDTPWLPAIRTARFQTGLVETDLLYSVNSVVIDGSNVVNSAQQRFFAKADDTWSVSLLLYALHITAKDALLRKPIGNSISVVLPNGQAVNYPLDKSGMLDLHALARGNYRVILMGVRGVGTSTPVALSRNQTVNLNVVTKPDVIIFFATSGIVALGLIIYGRPWLVFNISKRKTRSFHQPKQDFGG